MKKHNPLIQLNASAGSGKTYALTNRFVELLFDSDLAPCESCKPQKNKKYNFSELLAITFTNLAANQMKEKVISILKDYAFKKIPCENAEEAEQKSKQAHAMLETIFRQYGALNIRTIDSLLNQLMGLFALELGYSPQFETVFETDGLAKELYDALASRSIDGGFCREEFEELCRTVFEKETYDTFLAKQTVSETVLGYVRYMLQNNCCFTDKDIADAEKNCAFFKKEAEKYEKTLRQSFEALLQSIEDNNILLDGRRKGGLEKAKNGDFDSKFFEQENFSQNVVKKNTGDIADASKYFAVLKKSLENKDRAAVFAENYRIAVPFMKISRAVSLALPVYEKELQQINTQKMPYIIADILGASDTGIAGSAFLDRKKREEMLLSAAFCRLGTRLKHILYDEFQDTSIAQWQALKDLSAEALAGGGSVLFVGDVKQAIYGWRGGKAALFDDAPKELAQAGFKVCPDKLKYNWRSLGNVIEWNNAFFSLLCDCDFSKSLALLFPQKARKAIPSAMLDEVRESLRKEYRNVKQDIPESRKENAEGKGTVEVHMLRERESQYNVAVLALLPEMVLNLHKRHGEYRKIAVLTVSNKQASMVSGLLLEHGIPVVSQGSLGLKEHPLIAELIALLRFLANPLDDNAFCQVLLSEHLLSEAFHSSLSFDGIRDFLSKPRETSCFTAFKKAFPQMWEQYFSVLADGADLVTAYDMLCEVYKRMGIAERNPEADVYLLRLRELAHLAEEKGMTDLRAFLAWWDENGEKEKAPLPEGLNSVSVMTVHKSKGLEFDAVIVPWHDFTVDVQSTMFRTDIHKIEIPYDGKEYTLYAALKQVHGDSYYRAVFERIKESINVLYVGWTRAKAELHIFMPTVYEAEKEGAGYFYRFLQAMLTELKVLPHKKFAFSEDKDCLHAGEAVPCVLSEKSLRALEYAFYDDKCLLEESKEELAAHVDEKMKKEFAKILGEYTEQTKSGQKIEVPSGDTAYAAKALSRILNPETAKKGDASAKDKKEKSKNFKEMQKQSLSEDAGYTQAHSMDWLPQLRIFRTDLKELLGQKELSSDKRGTLIHKSLEYLVFSGNIQEDSRRACSEAMRYLPYGRLTGKVTAPAGDTAEKKRLLFADIQEKVQWIASLREPFGGAEFWFENGYKEHSITDENGSLFRVDLLVEIPETEQKKFGGIRYVAIDYKTGYLGSALPVPENKKQISNYIRLLENATGQKTAGLLLYLDAREYCLIEG